MKRDYKKLLVQFIKFSIVGVLAFCIDYGLFLLLTYAFGMYYIAASTLSFIASTIFNFLASMRYVFEGRENQTRTQQFVIFFALSLVGLGLNQLILWICVDQIGWYAWFGKLVATAVVMVFNFISRKYCLEEHQKR